jgi:hypothetical protein
MPALKFLLLTPKLKFDKQKVVRERDRPERWAVLDSGLDRSIRTGFNGKRRVEICVTYLVPCKGGLITASWKVRRMTNPTC